MSLRLIADIHGKTKQYYNIVKDCDYTLQMGDFGFRDSYSILSKLDPNKHFVLGGNHDSYTKENGKFIDQTPHFLGDYGLKNIDGFEFFFVRGGFSIDWMYRVEGLDWWRDEELDHTSMSKCLDLYEQTKPNIVISHECPASICNLISGYKTFNGEIIKPSRTANLLQAMLERHNPKQWYFAHHHKDWSLQKDGTAFICLNELSYIDIRTRIDSLYD